VLLGRFALTCCVADAMAIGLIVEVDDLGQMVDNAWYRVQGTIHLASLDGQPIPLIRAEQVEEVPMPEQPYLYN
jgi:putative membrane protein